MPCAGWPRSRASAASAPSPLLPADHVLQVDLRELYAFHRERDADVTLAGLPVPFGEQAVRTLLLSARDRTPGRGAPRSLLRGRRPLMGGRSRRLDPGATGRAWRPVTADVPRDDVAPPRPPRGRGSCRWRTTSSTGVLPGVEHPHGAYWHDPTSIEAYYGAQMELCGGRAGARPLQPLVAAARDTDASCDLSKVTRRRGRPARGRRSAASSPTASSCAASSPAPSSARGVIVESGAEVAGCVLPGRLLRRPPRAGAARRRRRRAR